LGGGGAYRGRRGRRRRVVRAMVLPRDERALLSVGTDRLGSEELVERQRGGDPLSVGPGAKQRSGGLSRSRGEQQGHLPRFTEVVLVRLDVVVRQAERERRVRVIPTDEMRLLRVELVLDAIPQPGHDVARGVAADRLGESEGGGGRQGG